MRIWVLIGHNKTVGGTQAIGMTKHLNQAAKVQRQFKAWKDKQKQSKRQEENPAYGRMDNDKKDP